MSDKPRRWPRHIIPEDARPANSVPETGPLFDIPTTCARCGGLLTGGGYCLVCHPALCGGCGERTCPVCRGSAGRAHAP
jgi:hypothetical protein